MKKGHPKSDLFTVSEFSVKFHDTDALGIVWHGNYIKYFEDAREDFGRAHGLSYGDVMREGFSTPIVRTVCNHLLPLKYGETFFVKTGFKNVPSAKLIFGYEILNDNEQVVCTGETQQVFWNRENQLQLYPPQFFIDWKLKNGIKD